MGFPGVEMIGSSIKIAQQNFGEHYKAIRKLVDTFAPDAVFPLMDLAVEANALGRYTIFPKDESATVPKDQFGPADLERLAGINITFDSRLLGYVETVKMMSVTLPPAHPAGRLRDGAVHARRPHDGRRRRGDGDHRRPEGPARALPLHHRAHPGVRAAADRRGRGPDRDPGAHGGHAEPGAVRGVLRASTSGTSPRASATAGSTSSTTRAGTPCTWSGRWSARGCTGSASTRATRGRPRGRGARRCRPRWW